MANASLKTSARQQHNYPMSAPETREILMECTRMGNIVRVAAVDPMTGTEVIFQAPASTSQQSLQNLAASKMRYVLGKKKN